MLIYIKLALDNRYICISALKSDLLKDGYCFYFASLVMFIREHFCETSPFILNVLELPTVLVPWCPLLFEVTVTLQRKSSWCLHEMWEICTRANMLNYCTSFREIRSHNLYRRIINSNWLFYCPTRQTGQFFSVHTLGFT